MISEAGDTPHDDSAEERSLRATVERVSARNRELRERIAELERESAAADREQRIEVETLRRELTRQKQRREKARRDGESHRRELERIRASLAYRAYTALRRLPGFRRTSDANASIERAERLVGSAHDERERADEWR